MNAGAQGMDIGGALVRDWGMGVTPLPRRGGVLSGRDAAARMLRVSYHAEVARVVLSIWDHDVCMATLRLAPEDVPELVRAMTAALLPPDLAGAPLDPTQQQTVTQQLAFGPDESPWQRPGPQLPPVPLSGDRGQASA
ncbi:MAG: hypothetical protein H0X18_06755 [Geodermatophilaceae bacterium]|nr:hypothetical protein [Geodermatophilaceae bacterium]